MRETVFAKETEPVLIAGPCAAAQRIVPRSSALCWQAGSWNPTASIPKPFNAESIKRALVGNQRQTFRSRLGDQHAVKRIAVRNIERACCKGMICADRQLPKALRLQVSAKINLGARSIIEYVFSPVKKAFHEAGRER